MLLLTCAIAGTGPGSLTWVHKTGAASTAQLVAADASNAIVMKHLILSVQNACNLYLMDGSSAQDGTDRLGPKFYLAANEDLIFLEEPLNLRTTKGNGLYIWFDTDPGTVYSYTTEKISN